MLTPEEIVSAVRSGRCRKIDVPRFRNIYYFADPGGNIYSLNNANEPKALEPKLGKGLWWVTLFESEGAIRKLMVGEIIAHTFLADQEHDPDFSTVVYADGDPSNNAITNLRWGSRQEQQKQLREAHFDKKAHNGKEKPISNDNESDATDEMPFVPETESDPLLDQLHSQQERLEKQQATINALREALAPFATFNLSPADNNNVGSATVLQTNKGTNKQSALTVQDFRLAQNAYESPTGESS